jgi:hypothetical protein
MQIQTSLYLRSLSKYINFAKVWTEKPKKTDNISYSDCAYNFYFIKNDEGLYIVTD